MRATPRLRSGIATASPYGAHANTAIGTRLERVRGSGRHEGAKPPAFTSHSATCSCATCATLNLESQRASNRALPQIECQERELPRIARKKQRRREMETIGAAHVPCGKHPVYFVRERTIDIDPVHELQLRVGKWLTLSGTCTSHLCVEHRVRQAMDWKASHPPG